MNPRLLKLIDTLSLPLAESATRRALRDFAHEAGFRYFAYLHLRGPESFAISNYPDEWQHLYIKRGYVRTDPVVTAAKHGPPIFVWPSKSDAGRSDIREFYADAARFGISSGMSISVPLGFKDRMAFTLASSSEVGIDIRSIDPIVAAVAVTLVHSRLARVEQDASVISAVHLSPREAECLRWWAEGVKIEEIADMLEIRARSVRSYIDTATEKLGAANNRQAATVAARMGLI